MFDLHAIARWFHRKPHASKRQRLIRRYTAIIVGTFIVLVGIIIAPLPGPGFTILGPLGLGVLATELVWAQRALKKLEQSELGVRVVADRIAVRLSRWLIAPAIVGYWLGAWWLSNHAGVDSRVVWAASCPAFVPLGYLAIRVLAVRPARGRRFGPIPASEIKGPVSPM